MNIYHENSVLFLPANKQSRICTFNWGGDFQYPDQCLCKIINTHFQPFSCFVLTTCNTKVPVTNNFINGNRYSTVHVSVELEAHQHQRLHETKNRYELKEPAGL